MIDKKNTTDDPWLDKLTPEQFRKYLDDFGFGSTFGIEADTEAKGTLSALDKPGITGISVRIFNPNRSCSPCVLEPNRRCFLPQASQ